MARTEGLLERRPGGYAQTVKNLLGVLLWGNDQYLNFGAVFGSAGYGIRDNNGVIEMKSAGGEWTPAGQAELAATYETVNKNINTYPYVLNYNGSDQLDTVVFTTPSGSITKTLGYDGNNKLSTVTLSGDLPAGLSLLTKTLGYTAGKLTSVAYS